MSSLPFPHLVLTDALPEGLAREARVEWPAPNWSGWTFRLDTPLEKYQACNDWSRFPTPSNVLLSRLLLLPVPKWLDTNVVGVPDTTLAGAGMWTMTADGFLDVHLDSDQHPTMNLHRVCMAMLSLGDDARPAGMLKFWDEDRKEPFRSIRLWSNTLVMFQTGDQSFWSLHGPANVLVVSWYGAPGLESRRLRSQFFGAAGDDDTARARARADRATMVIQASISYGHP